MTSKTLLYDHFVSHCGGVLNHVSERFEEQGLVRRSWFQVCGTCIKFGTNILVPSYRYQNLGSKALSVLHGGMSYKKRGWGWDFRNLTRFYSIAATKSDMFMRRLGLWNRRSNIAKHNDAKFMRSCASRCWLFCSTSLDNVIQIKNELRGRRTRGPKCRTTILANSRRCFLLFFC